MCGHFRILTKTSLLKSVYRRKRKKKKKILRRYGLLSAVILIGTSYLEGMVLLLVLKISHHVNYGSATFFQVPFLQRPSPGNIFLKINLLYLFMLDTPM